MFDTYNGLMCVRFLAFYSFIFSHSIDIGNKTLKSLSRLLNFRPKHNYCFIMFLCELPAIKKVLVLYLYSFSIKLSYCQIFNENWYSILTYIFKNTILLILLLNALCIDTRLHCIQCNYSRNNKKSFWGRQVQFPGQISG